MLLLSMVAAPVYAVSLWFQGPVPGTEVAYRGVGRWQHLP